MLDICYDVPPSWVVWLTFQPRRIMGRSGDTTVSPHGLLKTTLVDGFGIFYLMVYLKSICIYIYFLKYMYNDLNALMVSGIVLA